jgi:hypothetical protein
MKLRFATPDNEGWFLKPTRMPESVVDTFDRRFGASLPKPIFHRAHVGDTMSLIFAPFYIKDGKMIDAVLNKPVSTLPDEFDLDRFSGGRPNWPTGFLPTLCPNCGWDLKGQRDSLALLCHNCNSVWRPSGNALKRTPFAHIPPADNGEDIMHLPFWRIGAEITGIDLASYADLVRVANLPRVVREDWQAIDFRFWVPAFKVRPRVFINLECNMTLCQPQENLVSKVPPGRVYAVNLPLREALECLKTGLAGFMKPPGKLLPTLPGIDIKAKSFLLVYVPFSEGHHEYIHDGYKLAVNKNQLTLSANL